MRLFQAVVLYCFIKLIAGGNKQNIHETAEIQNLKRIGNNVIIGSYVKVFGNSWVSNYAIVENNAKIGPHCEIGRFSIIEADAVIANGSIIGNYCVINRKASVSNVRTSNNVIIGERSILHDNCNIRSYATIGNDAVIFENFLMDSYSSIANNVLIGFGSVFDTYSSALDASRIGSNVYIGKYASVRPNAVIEDNVVVHKHASVQDGTRVFKNEIIIQTPSSAHLYEGCLSLDRIQRSQVDRILNGNNENVNNILLDLMKKQLDQLVLACCSADFNLLQLITSLYLIRYHGRDSYEKYCRQSKNGFSGESVSIFGGNIFINGNDISIGQNVINGGSNAELQQEFHFGSNDKKKILNDEAKDQIIRLLAIQHDSQRNVRVQGDTYCKMSQDIRNKLRTVKCDM